MAVDPIWASAVLDQAIAEISVFLNDAGLQGIEQSARWLRAEHLQEIRRRIAPVEPLLQSVNELPVDLRARLDVYKSRLIELQEILLEMNDRLQQRSTRINSSQEELVKLRLWLAAYRNSG